MGIFGSLFDDDLFSSSSTVCDDGSAINPANGLPMIDGSCGVDIEGNAFGTDFSHDDDMFSSSLGGFDDDF